MRKDAIPLEEKRLEGITVMDDYPSFHERHRIFPDVFEDRDHKRILDISAGIGVVGKRIKDNYRAELICNDISPSCLQVMKDVGLKTTSFDLDDEIRPFPFPDGYFEAIICLATIEHIHHTVHFMKEITRILSNEGCLYLSAPNYSGLTYLIPFLWTGRTFHDPMAEESVYEFYAHVRYFTYRTLLEYCRQFGLSPTTVYLGVPSESSRYLRLKEKSPAAALAFKYIVKLLYTMASPRWAAEPVMCFQKTAAKPSTMIRKVVL